MKSLKPIKLKLSEKLQDFDYFHKFFDERTRDEVASQLRELRELREMSQVAFAAKSGMQQSAVSRIEQSDYSGWTYKTLLRAAHALRARLKIEFIPQERVIEEYRARESSRRTEELMQEMADGLSVESIDLTTGDPPEDGLESANKWHQDETANSILKPPLHSEARLYVEQ